MTATSGNDDPVCCQLHLLVHVQEALLLLHVHNHIEYGSIQGAVVLP